MTDNENSFSEGMVRSFLRIHQRGLDDSRNRFEDDDQDDGPYEFVAFLLWYVFLVLCCIVPTCCAYRRRRIIERRMAEQQANLSQFQQANLFFLQGSSAARAQNEEAMQQERFQWLTDTLKPTTLTISEHNLKEVDPTVREKIPAWEMGRKVSMHGAPDVEKPEEGPVDDDVVVSSDPPGEMADEINTKGNQNTTTNLEKAEPEITLQAIDAEDANIVLLLPPVGETISNEGQGGNEEANTTKTRELAGVCAICLSRYEPGDQVTWAAANMDCQQHAFHTDCIIPWLSKKEEPNCPVCRQSFCPPLVVQPPFGLPEGEGMNFPFSRSLAETVAMARFANMEQGNHQGRTGGNAATTTPSPIAAATVTRADLGLSPMELASSDSARRIGSNS